MAKTASIKVIALQDGFYGGQRVREGQEFMVESGEKGKWFAPVGSPEAAEAREDRAAKVSKDQVLNRPVALSEVGKAPPGSFVEGLEQTKPVKGEKHDKPADDKKKSDLA